MPYVLCCLPGTATYMIPVVRKSSEHSDDGDEGEAFCSHCRLARRRRGYLFVRATAKQHSGEGVCSSLSEVTSNGLAEMLLELLLSSNESGHESVGSTW